MAITTTSKTRINRLLERVNLRLETLTAERQELGRLSALEDARHFERPAFPIPPSFESADPEPIFRALQKYAPRFDDFQDAQRNDVGYTYENDYFTSPDAEVLYTIVREQRPETVVEVGSGHSTRIIRQAILDGGLKAKLISIDPQPRTEVEQLTDALHRKPVEAVGNLDLFESLRERDILFIDSSHEIKTGNDVVFLYLNVLPRLQPGVLVHIHDVFLPYDYPEEWVIENRWEWNEQYLVACLLLFGDAFEPLWPGYHLQRSRPDFAKYFPHLNGRPAQSLWLRRRT